MTNKLPDASVRMIYELSTINYCTIREIVKQTGFSKATIEKYRKILGVRGFKCGCGKLLHHRGWCPVRYQKSKARQKWMAYWHDKAWVEHDETARPDTCYYGAGITH